MLSHAIGRKGVLLPLVTLLAIANLIVIGFAAPANLLVVGSLIALGYVLAVAFAFLKDGEG